MAETVLVTGGTGFIGGWCIVDLLRKGYDVRATVRSRSAEAGVRAAVAAAVDTDARLSFVTADLTTDDGWDAAMTGCDYVIHVASPLGSSGSAGPDALIAPARDGTLRVLRAATNAGVKRVVMTSAAAAARKRNPQQISDETVWADADDWADDPYRLSKTLAERAAWDFMADQQGTSLTTILPGAVFGPVLTRERLGSVGIIKRLLEGQPPHIPRLGFQVVDVRDLADVHVRAMTSPEAAGERFLAASQLMWMTDIAAALLAELGDDAARVPTATISDDEVRALAQDDPGMRMITKNLGQTNDMSTAKARSVLAFDPRPAAETIVDCARSLLV